MAEVKKFRVLFLRANKKLAGNDPCMFLDYLILDKQEAAGAVDRKGTITVPLEVCRTNGLIDVRDAGTFEDDGQGNYTFKTYELEISITSKGLGGSKVEVTAVRPSTDAVLGF